MYLTVRGSQRLTGPLGHKSVHDHACVAGLPYIYKPLPNVYA